MSHFENIQLSQFKWTTQYMDVKDNISVLVEICVQQKLIGRLSKKCLRGTTEIDPQTVHQSVLPHWMQLVHTINFHPLSPIPRLRLAFECKMAISE